MEASSPSASATLPSNSGNAFLRIEFIGPNEASERSEVEADIHIVVPDWANGQPIPWEIKLSSLWLDSAAILKMRKSLELWLKLPLDELGMRKFAGTFELAARRHQRFCVSFGEREGTISGTNNAVSITVWGGLQADCRFVIDASCMQRFADDLRTANGQ
jgi:hypothetical protein